MYGGLTSLTRIRPLPTNYKKYRGVGVASKNIPIPGLSLWIEVSGAEDGGNIFREVLNVKEGWDLRNLPFQL